VVPIHAKLESVLPAYAGDDLISSCGFGIRLQNLGVDRGPLEKIAHCPIKVAKRSLF
jgi:hypothetical protein